MLDAAAVDRWVLIDEVQRVPTILDAVHQRMDREPARRFLVTGSSARSLHRDGVNLLGGRAGRRRPIIPSTALVERSGGIFEAVLTADGRTLVWRQDTPGTGTLRDIFAASVDSPSVARVILQIRFDERGIAVGPERDWLAYVSNESGRDEVYIRRLSPGSPRWPVSRNGGSSPAGHPREKSSFATVIRCSSLAWCPVTSRKSPSLRRGLPARTSRWAWRSRGTRRPTGSRS